MYTVVFYFRWTRDFNEIDTAFIARKIENSIKSLDINWFEIKSHYLVYVHIYDIYDITHIKYNA